MDAISDIVVNNQGTKIKFTAETEAVQTWSACILKPNVMVCQRLAFETR